MEQDYSKMQGSLVAIATETFRVSKVLEKVLTKIDAEDQQKYASQFAWFFKKVTKELELNGIRLVNLEGKEYQPGDAIVPLNIADFSPNETLYIQQMIEPIIMNDGTILKTGTALLERRTGQ